MTGQEWKVWDWMVVLKVVVAEYFLRNEAWISIMTNLTAYLCEWSWDLLSGSLVPLMSENKQPLLLTVPQVLEKNEQNHIMLVYVL